MDLYRLVVDVATGKGPWIPVPDAPEAELVARGHCLAGPVLDLGVLSPEEKQRWLRLIRAGASKLTAPEEREVRALNARLPRLTSLGVDVDVRDPVKATALAEQIAAEAARRGVTLRWALSGGSGRLHLEPGRQDVGHPDLLRAAAGFWGEVLAAAGLAPWRLDGKRWGVHDDGRFWAPARGWDPSWGFVDLSVLHRDRGSRGSLLRLLGARHKDGVHLKRLVPGRPAEGCLLPSAGLAPHLRRLEEEAARSERYRAGATRRRASLRLERGAGAGTLPRTRAVLASLPLPEGTAHDPRLALAAVLLERGVSRKAASHALEGLARTQHGRGDAWSVVSTTARRLEADLTVAGLPAARRALGGRAVLRVLEALHQDLAAPPPPRAETVLERRPPGARELRRVWDALPEDGAARKALFRARHCGSLSYSGRSGDDEEVFTAPLRCEREHACGRCAACAAELRSRYVAERWAPSPYTGYTVGPVDLADDRAWDRLRNAMTNTWPNRTDASSTDQLHLAHPVSESDPRRAITIVLKGKPNKHAERILHARAQKFGPPGCGLLATVPWAGPTEAGRWLAEEAVVRIPERTQALLQAGDAAGLEEHLGAWHRTRLVGGPKRMRLPWAGRAELRELRGEAAQAQAAEARVEPSEYVLFPTGRPELELAREEHPFTLGSALRVLEERGRVDPASGELDLERRGWEPRPRVRRKRWPRGP